MKNFLLVDSSELICVRLISASWAQKRLIPSFYTCSGSSSWKVFFTPIRASWWLLDSFRPAEPKNVWFLLSRHDVPRVSINSLLDSNELMAVRLISASWAQKRLILTFYQWCASSSWKIFFSSIRASWWLLDTFRPLEHKNVWFQVFTHVLGRVHEKFSSRRFERADGC